MTIIRCFFSRNIYKSCIISVNFFLSEANYFHFWHIFYLPLGRYRNGLVRLSVCTILYTSSVFLRFCVILNKSVLTKDNFTTNCVVFAIRVALLISKFGRQSNFRLSKSWQGVLPLNFSKTPEVSVALMIPWYFSNQITVF